MSENNRYPRTAQSKEIAESLCSVGTVIPQSFVSEESDKFFFLQGSNIVTVNKIKEVGDSNKTSIDLSVLFSLVLRLNVISLDTLCKEYAKEVSSDYPVTMTEEVKDFILGSLIMSQVASPISAIARHVMSWRSRSIVPRYSILHSDDLYEQRLYMAAQANPSGSIWDHFDSLIDVNMTKDQTDTIQHNVENALESLIKKNVVYVNVPASMYNQ